MLFQEGAYFGSLYYYVQMPVSFIELYKYGLLIMWILESILVPNYRNDYKYNLLYRLAWKSWYQTIRDSITLTSINIILLKG